MPSREMRHAAFDQLTIFVVFAAPFTAWRAFEPHSATGAGREAERTVGTRPAIAFAHLPMQTLSPFLLGSQERATGRPDPAPQPEPAAGPLTAKELAEARENARPQVTKDVKPPDTVRK